MPLDDLRQGIVLARGELAKQGLTDKEIDSQIEGYMIEASIKRANAQMHPDMVIKNAQDHPLVGERIEQAVKDIVGRTRLQMYDLARYLFYVRHYSLWRYNQNSYSSFREWLSQPEIDISEAKAYDLIHWWIYAVPVCDAAQISQDEMVNSLSDTKLRLLVKQFQRTAVRGEDMTTEDVQSLLQVAANSTVYELNEMFSGKEAAQYNSEEEITFCVVKKDDKYVLKERTYTEKQLSKIDRKLKPIWVDPSGRILGKI